MVRIIRSYPLDPPEGRTYVIDPSCETWGQTNYDYTGLASIGEDIVLIEWDIAPSREDIVTLVQLAELQRSRPIVAAHLLYHVATRPVWAHRVLEDKTLRWIRPGESYCHLFALGMAYLPHKLLAEFESEPPRLRGKWPWEADGDPRFTDHTFSVWHYKKYGPTRVAWDVRPVHLHYS